MTRREVLLIATAVFLLAAYLLLVHGMDLAAFMLGGFAGACVLAIAMGGVPRSIGLPERTPTGLVIDESTVIGLLSGVLMLGAVGAVTLVRAVTIIDPEPPEPDAPAAFEPIGIGCAQVVFENGLLITGSAVWRYELGPNRPRRLVIIPCALFADGFEGDP